MNGNTGGFFVCGSSSSEGYVDGYVDEDGVGWLEETGVVEALITGAFLMLNAPCFLVLAILQIGCCEVGLDCKLKEGKVATLCTRNCRVQRMTGYN